MATPLTSLPFTVDRAEDTELSVQISRGLRSAIHNGVFAPGQRLPGIRQIARELGTSNIVVTQAINQLVEDGLVVARPRSGTRVLAEHERTWRGHVLWLGGTLQPYYFSAREEVVAKGLAEKNFRLTAISYLGHDPEADAAILSSSLQTMGITLVVDTLEIPGIQATCLHHHIPLVTCSKQVNPGINGQLIRNNDTAMVEMADHVADLGCEDVMVLSPHAEPVKEVEQILAIRGIAVKVGSICWRSGLSPMETNEMSGHATVSRLISEGRLPQLLYVTDDYMARGCLTALLEGGIKIPEALQMVVRSNYGNRLVFSREFTRIESDPLAEGEAILQLIMRVAGNGAGTKTATRTVESTFIIGETTTNSN